MTRIVLVALFLLALTFGAVWWGIAELNQQPTEVQWLQYWG